MIIGLFTEAFNPGMLVYQRPKPLETATTAADVAFRFSHLEPDRSFVVPIDARTVVTGRWVDVSSDRATTVRLIG